MLSFPFVKVRAPVAWTVPALAVCAAFAADTQVASAQDVACSSLPAPIVYGRGGSASNQLVGRLAVEIAESSAPLTVVYKDDGACFAMESLIGGQKLTGTAKYWIRDAENKIVAKTCTLPTNVDEAPSASWGAMAQLATTCPGVDALPADVSDGTGPISGFSLIVPNASTQQVISAEAAYYIYGLGVENPENHVAPWTVPLAVATRTTTSAAGLLLAKAVGIDLSHTLYGTDVKNNQGAVDYITTTSQAARDNPEAAIGFCSTETADANRDKVRTLAFQANGQDFGYWPDSNGTTALDKINIREGRYYLWNPHHFYAKLDGAAGDIPNADTKRWVGYLTETVALPDDLNWLDIQVGVGVVPQCAMHVNRDDDVGPLYSYQPDAPCGCYFEFKATGVAPEACVECEAADGAEDAACPDSAKVCRHGFCEVK